MGSKKGQRAWKDAPKTEEFKEMLDATANGKEKLILHLLGTVGLRDGEVVRLTAKCLREDGYLEVPGTKTRFARRTLPLKKYHSDIWGNLAYYLAKHERMKPGTTEGIRILVRRIGDRVGLDVYPHALRGRAAYDMGRVLKGDGHKLAAWMGWKSIAEADAYIQASDAIWFEEDE